MDTEIFEEIGFSKSESIVYLALLKIGQTKAGKIIKATGLQSSVVHNALNTLEEKGFVTHFLEGKIKRYSALNPKLINRYLETKKKEFESILPQLEKLKKKPYEIVSSEIYYGYNGLMVATLKIIEESREKVWKYFVGEGQLYSKKSLEFFHKTDLIKKEKGLKVKGIAEFSGKSMLKEYKDSEIRYTNMKIPPAMNIFGNYVLIFYLSEKPIAVLIHSKQIAEQYHRLWDSLWKIAK